MNSSRLHTFIGVLLVGVLPAGVASAQQMAIRHSGTNCFGSKQALAMVDLYDAAVPLNDWGAMSSWTSSEHMVFCPVSMTVPTVAGSPIDGARVVYATTGIINVGSPPGTPVTPVISSCSVYLMDSTAGGTWVRQSPIAAGPDLPPVPNAGQNTGDLHTNGVIIMGGGPTVNLGGGALKRIVITCQMPKALYPSGSSTYQRTAIIKGYEVTYTN